MKKILACMLSAALLAGMAVSSPVSAAEGGLEGNYEFIVGSSSGAGTTNTKMFEQLQDRIGEDSDGHMAITYYGSSSLGSDSEMLAETVAGNLTMCVMTTASLTGTIPEMAIFDMQCVTSQQDTYAKLLEDEEFRAEMQSWFEAANLHLVAWDTACSKILASTKEISSFEDFAGYDMRTLNNKFHIDFWREVGCNTLQVDAGECYLSLQQGLINGVEMSISGIVNRKFAEVCKSIIDTQTLPQLNMVVMSLTQYNAMSDADKAWFDNYMKDFSAEFTAMSAEDQEAGWQELEDAGMICVHDSSALFEDFRAAAEKTTWVSVREAIGDEVVDGYIDAVNRIEGK